MRDTWVWSVGWEDPLKKGKATHSSILAWRIYIYIYILHGLDIGHGFVKSQTQLNDFHVTILRQHVRELEFMISFNPFPHII